MAELQIKFGFIEGVKEIVLGELKTFQDLKLKKEGNDWLYFEFINDLKQLENLRSVTKAYVVVQDIKFNPLYISKHKSILGNLVEIVLNTGKEQFHTFKITCAGRDSKEVRNIALYITETFKLTEAAEADIKIHIIKISEIWEVGIQLTKRPLSLRYYKVKNIEGGINPTIAYAMNSLCNLNDINFYLNIFSGGATLLIEAGISNPKLKLMGFDKNRQNVSSAIQNIKKAGLIKSIELKAVDIFDKPSLGKFDIITSDLPFGMAISKGEKLRVLYETFVKYCEQTLNSEGRLVVYTTEHEMLNNILEHSKFNIIQTLDLKFLSSVNAYLYPKIFVCKYREIKNL